MMTDREKIIKGLECCSAMSGDECRECPYGHECRDTDLPYGMPHLAADVLALLKEQETVVPKFLNYTWRCGSCNGYLTAMANHKIRFCPYCGKVMKWDD